MKALIIGLGLIGGSLAKAFKHYNIAQHITVFDPNQNSCNLALEQNVANEICHDLTKISQYQIIVIACPIRAFVNVAPIVFKFADKNALIFDVGSLKNFAELDFSGIKPNFDPEIFNNLPDNFVPAHPIAGSHLTGYENSCENLFADKDFVICRRMHNAENLYAENLWEKNLHKIIEKIGAKPHYLTAKEHDKIYALVSHLPQYLSFLSNYKRELDTNQLSSLFFQRCFRLNNSDRDLWQEIFDLNQKNFSIFFQEWKGNFDIISKAINNAKNPFKILRTYLVSDQEFSLELDDKFYKDFNNNRKDILHRLVIVIAYLEIKKIQDYKKYAGKGFADFTSIIKILSASEDVWLN